MLSTSYWQPRTPADRPGIMLFSPVMGKKCNTKMCMVYVWKEMNKQVQAYGRKPGTDSVRSPAFSPGCWAPRVPADGGSSSSAVSASLRPAGLLAAGASISITPLQCMQEASQSARGIRGDLVLCLCHAGHPGQSAGHITLRWVTREEGGQEVLWDGSGCALETWAGRIVSFPVYFFTSSFPVTAQGRLAPKVASCVPYTSPKSVFLIYI